MPRAGVRSAITTTLGLLLLALTAASAPAASKPYSLTITPGTVAAGTQSTFTAHFAVPASASQQLGSADVTVPAGFTVVSASVPAPGTATVTGGTVRLRNLAVQPGHAVDATVVARAPCTAGTSSWTVLAKQANDFNGPPGNDLTLVAASSSLTTTVTGSCGLALRFVTQPTAARVGQVISGSPYAPGGPPVSVEVVDAAGARVTTATDAITIALGAGSSPGTLSGTLTVNAVAGLAAFSTLRISAPGTFTLAATAAGLTSATSASFKVDTVVTACTEDVLCTGTTSSPTTKVDVSAFADPARPDSGFLALSLNVGPALDCAGYTEISPDTALLDVTAANRTKTVSLTIDKRQMNAVSNNGASFLQLCFASPAPFTTLTGTLSPQQGTFDWNADGVADPQYVGLLPDCDAFAPPCVVERKKVGAGDGFIQARLPAGLADPRMRG